MYLNNYSFVSISPLSKNKPRSISFFRGLVTASTLSLLLTACQSNEPYVIGGEDGNSINVGGPLEDSLPLSTSVRQALKKNPRTMLALIEVSSPSEDTVRLTGFVNDDATKHEAERVAGNVSGVRFVVNVLEVR